MSATQIAAQQLAQAIARLRLAERDAKLAIDQAGHVFAVVRNQHYIQRSTADILAAL